MEKLHHSNFFFISIDKKSGLLFYNFNENTSKMTSEEYLVELKIFIALVHKYKPKKILGDMKDFLFPIDSMMQEWIANNLFSVYNEISLQRLAILLSEELIAALSIEQTIEEGKSNSFETSYFENYDKAYQWLLISEKDLA